ncbi:MAG: hypothetical protein ACYC2H_02390 [Thermoplasmatota archaeon]
MDASKQATGKDDTHKGHKDQRDDVRQDTAKGRYEGGRDSDQNRQAKDRGQNQKRRDDKTPEPAATQPTKDRHGMEEEE